MSLGHADFSDFEDRDERPDDEQRKEPCDDQEAAKPSERELDGGFPEWVWLRLRRHRKELGLSLAEPDAKLGVDWETVRKWETGETWRCHPSFVPVTGDYPRSRHAGCLCRRPGTRESSELCPLRAALLSLLRDVPGLNGDTQSLVEGILILVRHRCCAGGCPDRAHGGSDIP